MKNKKQNKLVNILIDFIDHPEDYPLFELQELYDDDGKIKYIGIKVIEENPI